MKENLSGCFFSEHSVVSFRHIMKSTYGKITYAFTYTLSEKITYVLYVRLLPAHNLSIDVYLVWSSTVFSLFFLSVYSYWSSKTL